MKFRLFRSLILCCCLAAAGQALAVAVDEEVLDDPALEARAREIMTGIRCLVCQNQSIEDSNADLARDLRGIVRERVRAGDDDDQVRAYLVARYGDWVLLKPPLKARTIFLWFGPFVLLAVGAGALVLNVRRRSRAPAELEPLSAEEERRIKQLVAGGRKK